jgi:hypothetical protein
VRSMAFERALALLRMVRDEPSLRRVKDVMGHDLVQGVIPVFLEEFGAGAGPAYRELSRRAMAVTPEHQRSVQSRLRMRP